MFEKIEKYKSSISNIRQLIYQENRLNHVTLDDTKIHMQVQSNEFVFPVVFKVDSNIVDDKIVYSISLNLPFDFEYFSDQTNQPLEAFWELKHRAWVALYSNLKKIESKNKPDHDVENIIKDILKKYDPKPEIKEDTERFTSDSVIVNSINSNINNNGVVTHIPLSTWVADVKKSPDLLLNNDEIVTSNRLNTANITDSVSNMRSEIVEGLENLNSSIKELVQEIKLEREKPSLLKRLFRRFAK